MRRCADEPMAESERFFCSSRVPSLFLGTCEDDDDDDDDDAAAREPRHSSAPARARPRSITSSRSPSNMCPIEPGAAVPTKPGVYWRDTSAWVRYSDASATKIRVAEASLAKKDAPGSPRGPLDRAPSPAPSGANSSPWLCETIVDLGDIGPSWLGGGSYRVDLARRVQISPRGFVRKILLVD
jgi:hypothetical protein